MTVIRITFYEKYNLKETRVQVHTLNNASKEKYISIIMAYTIVGASGFSSII